MGRGLARSLEPGKRKHRPWDRPLAWRASGGRAAAVGKPGEGRPAGRLSHGSVCRRLELRGGGCYTPIMLLIRRPRWREAITFVELLVVVAVTSVLLLLLAGWLRFKQKDARMRCVNQLQQLSLAVRVAAADERTGYPAAWAATHLRPSGVPDDGAAAWFRGLKLGQPTLLVCPADTRRPARTLAELKNENLSYFVGLDADETRPQALLAGDRNLSVNGAPVASGWLLVTTNHVLGLTGELHGYSANIALADGSVQSFEPRRLREHLAQVGLATNRFLVP